MGCGIIPEVEWYELYSSLARRHIPVAGGIELTWRCNLRCVHCYCRLPADDLAAQQAELTTRQVCDIIDDMADHGTLYLFVTGGEPLLKRDFCEIWSHAKRRGLLLTLFTNAALVTEPIAQFLEQHTPFVVEVSLYGASEETYEQVTGIPGSFERCMTGIRLLVDHGLRVNLKTPVMTLNRRDIDQLRAWAHELGCSFRYDLNITPRIDGGTEPQEFQLSPEEALLLDTTDDARVDRLVAYWERVVGQPRESTAYKCGAGNCNFFVDPQGNLVMCPLSRLPGYDLRHGEFAEGWNRLRELRQMPASEANGSCHTCKLAIFCDQCPGRSQLQYGLEGYPHANPHLCALAHGRVEALRQLRPSSPVWQRMEVKP